MYKKLFILCLVITFGMIGHIFYLHNHREFGPGDFNHPFILTRAPSSPDETVKQEASAILKQPFTYLGCGGQMTAYESPDGRYVVKFFNPRSVINKTWFQRPQKLLLLNSWKWISNTYFKKQERLEKYFKRCEISYNDLKAETGLVYIHVDPATSLSQTIQLTGKDGKTYQLDLETNPFVLQKKVVLTFEHIDHLLKQGKTDEAKEATRQIYTLFAARAQKGYKDRLQALEKNYGFVGGKLVQFDTGRLRKDHRVLNNPQKEVKRVISNIKPSFENYPELAQVLDECLEQTVFLGEGPR